MNMRLALNEYDVRYLASCHSLELNVFKRYLLKYGSKEGSYFLIDWRHLRGLFPKLDKNYISKLHNSEFLEEGTITRYFEEVSIENHNCQVLKELLNRINIKEAIVDFRNFFNCLVLVGKKEENFTIFTPLGKIEEKELYLGYLTCEEPSSLENGSFFTLHNLREGKRIVIRIIDESSAKSLISSTLNYFNTLRNILYEA